MGIVRSIQKGEQPASKFSKDAQDAAKSMKKGSVKKYAKTKHDDLPLKKESLSKSQIKKMRDEFDKTGELPPHLKKVVKGKKEFEKKFKVKDIVIPGMEWMSKLGEERDYKDEYKKFQSSTKSKKYRAELNKYNRKKGTYGNGDGKDASHKGGKIVGFEKESKNRGRAEKSRLKKENNMPDFNPIIDEVLDEVFGEYQMNENSKVLKSIENLAKQNKYGNVTGTKMNGKTANLIMKIYNHPKMKKYQKAMEKYTSDELVDMTLKIPKVLGIKENVDEALDPYKDFDGSPKEEYNLNLGAFVEHYQDFIKFMKKHKEVPDKNKREWALAIRNKVGRGMFNGHMSQMSNIMDLLQMGDKFRNLKESVNEGQKRRASDILRKFDMAYIKFSQEVRDVMKLMDKSTGSKVDGKIINKAYGKHLIPFDDLMQSWAKGQQENPGLSEDETLEGLGDKFGKKLDKYNKKNKKSKDALKKYAKLKKK